jgi:transcriptional regulator with XRE-family HTH domain
VTRTTLLAVSQADDDERLGLLLRKLRRRAGQTQAQLAAVAQIPIDDVSAIETGQVGRVRVDRVRAAFGGVDGRLYLRPWYMGAAADRLLDEDHAAIVEEAASVFARRVWRPEVEVTFSEFGERGSIDLFAAYEATRTVVVCEMKSAFGSLEETNRSLDVKVRLAPGIAERVFGWQPAFVGRLLIVPDQSPIRRVVRVHAATMTSLYPARSRQIRAWLRKPDCDIAGIWFLSIPADSRTKTP